MSDIEEFIMENSSSSKIGFIIAAIIGYWLYKMVTTKSESDTQNTESESDNAYLINNMHQYDNYKLVLVIRTDLKMGKGKVAAQCAHAAVAAYKSATKYKTVLTAWEECGQAKITVKVDSEKALHEVARNARAIGLLTNLIQDAGHTQVPSGSRTVCAIGPGPAGMIDQVTGHLKLF